ncbi:MAG: hypothetical protein OER56_03740 [Hyphomicrobiales bacterium]|nr:hypothetical protein [Hyphomicrobiales bacterium]
MTEPTLKMPGVQTRPQSGPPALNGLLLLVGQMNYAWTNTESLLIHLIAGLADIDKEVATVIFLTLNTTRARLDLVERLSKLERADETCRRDVLAVTRKFSRVAKIRNKYNHCIYSFDPASEDTSTIQMRIFDDKTSIRFGKNEKIGQNELQKVRTTIDDIETMNLEIWSVIQRHGFPI